MLIDELRGELVMLNTAIAKIEEGAQSYTIGLS